VYVESQKIANFLLVYKTCPALKSIHKIYAVGGLSFFVFWRIIDSITDAEFRFKFLALSILCGSLAIGITYLLSRRSVTLYYKAGAIGVLVYLCTRLLSYGSDFSLFQSIIAIIAYSAVTVLAFNGLKLFEDDPKNDNYSSASPTPSTNKFTYDQKFDDLERKKRSLEVDITTLENEVFRMKNKLYYDESDETNARFDLMFKDQKLSSLKSDLWHLDREQRNL
jgi:hypothetical protein